MDTQFIVRADFYPDGNIIPIGITDRNGDTIWIQKVRKVNCVGTHDFQFDCIAHRKNVTLLLTNNHWTITIK